MSYIECSMKIQQNVSKLLYKLFQLNENIRAFYSEQYRNDIKKYIIFSASVTLHGHNGPIYGLSFSPDRSLLLSCSEDGTIRLWSLQTWTCLVNYKVWNIIHLYITQGILIVCFAMMTSNIIL